MTSRKLALWASLTCLQALPSPAADEPSSKATEPNFHRIEAQPDVELEPLVPSTPPVPRTPDDTTPLKDVAAEPVRATKSRLGLGFGVGPLAASRHLRVGLAARAEAYLHLHEVSDRLALLAFAGTSFASGQGAVMLPGRGFDPALRVSRQTTSFAFGGRVDAFRDDQQAVGVSLAYAPAWVRQSYGVLGASAAEAGVSHGGLLALSYRHRLGPGEAGLSVEGGLGSARLGKLGALSTDPFASLAAVFSYSFALLTTTTTTESH